MSMNTPLEPSTPSLPAPRADKPARKKSNRRTYLLLILAWIALVALGLWGGRLYTEHLRAQIAAEIAAQTETALTEVKNNYSQELEQLKSELQADMAEMQTKIDSVNELLAFTKDSASDKMDNSNQLYSQLAEVKKQLDELKKNLDILK